MRTIGLIGGMSWTSTAEYYRLLNEAVMERLGGLHSAQLVLVSVDFAEIEHLQSSGDWESAGRLLAQAGRQLESAGADLVLLCTNTMHKVADAIEAAITVPLLHIVDVAAARVARTGLTSVGLLGTSFTMQDPLYPQRFASHGARVMVPPATQQALVHRVIYDELCRGIVDDGSRSQVAEVIADLARRGAQGVILGCTELEQLIAASDSPVPVFPTTRLHVAAAVDASLA